MDFQESTDKLKGVAANSTSIDNDANPSQKMTIVLLNGFNYLPWSRAVTIALGGRSCLGFINGKELAPDSSSPEFEQWLAKDQMVMSWMLNSMDRNLAEMFGYYQSSLELWEAVREMYGNQNNSARIFQIQQDIASLHQNGQPFVNLLSKLKCFSYGGPPYSYNPNITYATELVAKGWSSGQRSCHCNHFLQNTSTDYSTPRINSIIYAINGEFAAWLKLLI